LAPQPDGSPVPRIWDNANIVESYPGLTLPLSFSFARHNYEVAFRNAALGFQLSGKAMGPDLSIFPNMIGLLDGRVYYNLRNWYVMLSYLPGFEQRKEAWDQMIGIAEDSPCPHADLTRLQRWGNLLTTTYRLLTVRRTNKRFFTHFRSTYTQYQNADLSVHTDEDLIALYESLCEDFLPQWHLTLYNDLFAMTFYRWLQKLCSRWGVSADPNLHNDLLVGEEGMESVAPVRSLARLAALVSRTPRYSQLFDTDDDEAVWSRLRDDARFGELADGIDEHLRLFGDRGPEELKLEKASLREEPARLIGLIRAYIQHGQTVEAMEQREWEVRQGARTRADQRLKGRLRRALFNFVLRQTRYGTTSRENMRFARTRLYGRARQLFGRMAELFVERGLIDARADFYYLTVQEAFGLVQGTAVTLDVRPLIQIRKAEYAAFAERVPRERMQITGIPSLGMTYETATGSSTQHRLVGTGCSSGRVQGNARVVTDPTEPLGEGDHILIAGSTDPGWVFLMTQARGIVVERGSVLSHTAIIGRELGIPTVVGAEGATTLIPEGARVSIDGSTGEIQWQ